MAKVGNNIVTTGLSGKLGNLLVFRNRAGKTIVSQAPGERKGEWTDAQLKHRARFQEAIIYAKSAIADETTKEAYKTAADNGQSAFNVAVADFMNAPHIDEIDMSSYTGEPGGYIQVRAVDDFQVAEVSVSILNADGSEVEKGMAELVPGNSWWKYSATAKNDTLQNDKIIIRVSDIPGNLTEMEKEIE
ncbi:MAG TPA: hypothetical protein VE912_18185 [Bacteroidales bacterium]|nr:hypothetical protein [Bacteroidales bacterium]